MTARDRSSLDTQNLLLKQRFLRFAAGSLAALLTVMAVINILVGQYLPLVPLAASAAMSLTAALMSSRKETLLFGVRIFTYGGSLAIGISYASIAPATVAIAFFAPFLIVHAFLDSPQGALRLHIVQAVAFFSALVIRYKLDVEPTASGLVVGAQLFIAVTLVFWMLWVFSRNALRNQTVLDGQIDIVDRTIEQVRLVAKGDLTVTITENGDLPTAVRDMTDNLRNVVDSIVEAAIKVTSAAEQILVTTKNQVKGSVEQSSAVEENRRTVDSLVETSRGIAASIDEVQQYAEKSDSNSQAVAEQISALSTHTQRIEQILQSIQEIAFKSELLALNAALEGTKAGEIGRGFSLVAGQMQMLAEDVMSAVTDISKLVETITASTRTTVLATEESTKLAAMTSRSAKQIGIVVQQQRSGTEQVARAMEDVAQIAREAAAGSKQIASSATDLSQLAKALHGFVNRFRTRPN